MEDDVVEEEDVDVREQPVKRGENVFSHEMLGTGLMKSLPFCVEYTC
jgi:hypothetical protein